MPRKLSPLRKVCSAEDKDLWLNCLKALRSAAGSVQFAALALGFAQSRVRFNRISLWRQPLLLPGALVWFLNLLKLMLCSFKIGLY